MIAEGAATLSIEEEAIIVAFRRHTLLPLDDCLYVLQATIPHLTPSSLHRCLRRHKIKAIIADMPTYGYRRVHAILRRNACSESRSWPNAKRVYRVMKVHGMLLQRYTGAIDTRRHDDASPSSSPIDVGAQTASHLITDDRHVSHSQINTILAHSDSPPVDEIQRIDPITQSRYKVGYDRARMAPSDLLIFAEFQSSVAASTAIPALPVTAKPPRAPHLHRRARVSRMAFAHVDVHMCRLRFGLRSARRHYRGKVVLRRVD